MAQSASSVRRVLRKAIRSPRGPDFRLSSVLRSSFLGQKFNDKLPGFLGPISSDGSHIATVKTTNNISLNETPELKFLEQRWTHHSLRANSSFVLHPFILMGSRGLASASTKDDPTKDVTPTTPSDELTEGAQHAAKTLKDWAETAYNGLMDSATAVGDAIDVATPPIQKFLEDHTLILEISVPVTIFTGAWVILPRVLRQLHTYMEMGSAALTQGQESSEMIPYQRIVPYELSVFKAMEDPARVFATLLIALQVGMIVAPSAAVAQYMTQFWNGGSVLCIVWFLQRWKSAVFQRLLTGRQITLEDRERYLGLNKFSSLGLIFIGALGLAEAAGVALSSLLTVGGIGGIATAFAAREILANLLTGLTLSFSKPFTVGDTIKAGTVEGKVKEVGMFSTYLLTPEKVPITVPNGYFTNQAIINKSRAPWRYLAVKIPIHLNDYEKIPTITLEIREMIYRNPQVFLGEDKPSCHIAQFSPSALELAISCNIKSMSKHEYLLIEQGILVEAARIITSNGATLGGP